MASKNFEEKMVAGKRRLVIEIGAEKLEPTASIFQFLSSITIFYFPPTNFQINTQSQTAIDAWPAFYNGCTRPILLLNPEAGTALSPLFFL